MVSIVDPNRHGIVKETDDSFDIIDIEIQQHVAVVVEGRLGVNAPFGFDAAPLDAHVVGVDAELLGPVDVGLEGVEVPVVRGLAGLGREGHAGELAFVVGPLVRVVAFDFVRGGRRTPHEAGRHT